MENLLNFIKDQQKEWEGKTEILDMLDTIKDMVEKAQGRLIEDTKSALQRSVNDSEKLGQLIQSISFVTGVNFCLNCGCIVKVGPYCPTCDRIITVRRIAAIRGLETKSVIPAPPQENAEITEMQHRLQQEHDREMLDDWKREQAEDEESRFNPYDEYGVPRGEL